MGIRNIDKILIQVLKNLNMSSATASTRPSLCSHMVADTDPRPVNLTFVPSATALHCGNSHMLRAICMGYGWENVSVLNAYFLSVVLFVCMCMYGEAVCRL